MGREEIINRILADARSECDEILAAAKREADGIIASAEARAKEELAETKAEADERAKSVADGRAAAARLDSAKIYLAEKRRVIDEIYARALSKLVDMKSADSLKLLSRLIAENAEEGDEVVLAENFKFAADVAKLPVIKERNLTISATRAKISGGCLLRGKKSDKDLSFDALLSADMEEHQADIAAQLFVIKD